MPVYRCRQPKNYYVIILLQSGELNVMVDFLHHTISAKAIICLSPYQPHQFIAGVAPQGWLLRFHSDFFCTYRHANEVAVEGTLFHNNYQLSHFPVNDDSLLQSVICQMRDELVKHDLAQHELLVSYLKIFLINVLRVRAALCSDPQNVRANDLPDALVQIRDSIERQYRAKHSPGDYADIVHLSPKTVGKLVKRYFNKTLTDLIAQRIVIEAKRELYLTSKSVKEIASLLGYSDEFYFSRFFKRHAGVSPKLYRNTVGFAKAE